MSVPEKQQGTDLHTLTTNCNGLVNEIDGDVPFCPDRVIE